MWKHLDQHKRRNSLILFGLNLAAFVTGFLLAQTTAAKVILLMVFIGLSVVSVFYYVSGVPGLTQAVVIVLLFALMLPLSMFLNNQSWLTSFLSFDIGHTIGIILFILLTVLIPLPRMARELVRMKLGSKSKRSVRPTVSHENRTKAVDPAELIKATMVIKPAETAKSNQTTDPTEQTHFQQVGQYKRALIDSFRSWSLINATPLMRWLRIGAAGILFALSVLALFVADNLNEGGTDFFRSPSFYLLVSAGFAFFYAAGLLTMSFLRGLAVPAIAALTLYSLYTVIRLQSTLADRPLILRLLLILLACVLYGLILYLFINGFRKRNDLFNWIYRREQQTIGVDIALKDLLPIEGYTERITAVIEVDSNTDDDQILNQIIRINGWFHRRLSARRILPCGFIYDTAKGELLLVAYSKANIAHANEAFCRRILNHRQIKAKVSCQTDPDWQTYLELLYPDSATLHDIINEQQLQMLEDQGVDLQETCPIRLELRFTDNDQLQLALDRLVHAGYAAVTSEQMDDREQAAAKEQSDMYLVFIDLTTRLGLERLNTITRGIICLIQPLGGDLFGWELIGVEDDGNEFGEPGSDQKQVDDGSDLHDQDQRHADRE